MKNMTKSKMVHLPGGPLTYKIVEILLKKKEVDINYHVNSVSSKKY